MMKEGNELTKKKKKEEEEEEEEDILKRKMENPSEKLQFRERSFTHELMKFTDFPC